MKSKDRKDRVKHYRKMLDDQYGDSLEICIKGLTNLVKEMGLGEICSDTYLEDFRKQARIDYNYHLNEAAKSLEVISRRGTKVHEDIGEQGRLMKKSGVLVSTMELLGSNMQEGINGYIKELEKVKGVTNLDKVIDSARNDDDDGEYYH